MIHDLDIDKWPDATFAKWSALVDKTPGLEWNKKVVNPSKISARTAQVLAASLAMATSIKTKT